MMIGTTIINGVMGLVSVIAYMLVIQDVEEQILGAGNAYPWIGVFEVATGSKAGAVGMTIPFIILSFGRLPDLFSKEAII
jgi:choline transport protein